LKKKGAAKARKGYTDAEAEKGGGRDLLRQKGKEKDGESWVVVLYRL
jgi:hypothetical protein